jgi:hypothetical protein
MNNKDIRLTGQIGSDGELYIYNQTALSFFGKKNPNSRIIIEVKILGENGSKAMSSYFRNFILPEFQKAIRENGEYLTLKGTEQFISEITPMLQKEVWSEKINDYIVEYLKFEDLSNYEGSHCITHLKQLAAMEYGFDIDDQQFTNN